MYAPPPERCKAIPGQWRGKGQDTLVESNAPGISFTAEGELHISGRKLEGSVVICAAGDDKPLERLKLSGGFHDDSIVQLTYSSADFARKQPGVILLRLDATGRKLHGHYAGYSPFRETYVAGTVEFWRE